MVEGGDRVQGTGFALVPPLCGNQKTEDFVLLVLLVPTLCVGMQGNLIDRSKV
jgi:hypothetical protein